MRVAICAVYVVCSGIIAESRYDLLQQVPPRTSDVNACSCEHPQKGQGVCYEPVCPAGYYKCCSTCAASRCFGRVDLMLSWRGVPECLRCAAGDYCEGCDTYQNCPVSTQEGREGPRVCKAGTARLADCETCPKESEASIDNSMCVKTYTDKCDKAWLKRCIRGCESPDITRRKKLTECEMMKCTMYCAKSWSDECAEAVSHYCLEKTGQHVESNPLGMSEEKTNFIEDCDVKCSSSPTGHSLALTLIVPAFWLLAYA